MQLMRLNIQQNIKLSSLKRKSKSQNIELPVIETQEVK